MRVLRLATVSSLGFAALVGCSLVLDFDDLLPLPTRDAAVITDSGDEAEASVEAGIVCPGGFADCDGDASVCETPITSDSENCGACKRSCGGTACTNGACAPIILSRDESPAGIAADGEFVYWANNNVSDGGVSRILPDGGSRVSIAFDAQRPLSVAVDETYVYWVTNLGGTNFVRRASKSGGATETLVDAGRVFTDLALTGTNVLWSVRDGDVGLILSVAKSGGTPATLATNQRQPFGIATDGTSVFWVTATDARINQALLDGGDSKITPAVNQNPQELATDGQRVYWTSTSGASGVYSSAIPIGGAITTLTTLTIGAFGIAVDAKNVYWATQNAVQRMSKDGSGPIVTLATLSASQAGIRKIAIDDQNVYFTVASKGLVLKTPK